MASRPVHHAVKRLVVDARMLGYSGIGTYLDQVLPRILPSLAAFRPVVLVQEHQTDAARAALGPHATIAPWSTTPMSARELTQAGPAVENSVWWVPHINVPLRSKASLVVTLHDLLPLHSLPGIRPSLARRAVVRLWLNAIRRRALRVLCVSEHTRADAIDLGHIPAAVTRVTHLAASEEWRPIMERETTPSIVFVGLLKPHKNLAALLRAFDSIRERIPHRLVLVAKHEGLRSIDRAALERARTMAPRVELHDHVSRSELVRIVSRADLLVHPSLHEGFGLTPLEAMAAGVPVIATRTGAIPEYGGDAIRYWDPAAPADLAAAMLDVLRNPQERARMSQRGIELARKLSWDACAGATCAALIEALQGAETPS